MDLKPKSYEKICKLLEKGVDIPNPGTLDIGDEVNIDQISGKGVNLSGVQNLWQQNSYIAG